MTLELLSPADYIWSGVRSYVVHVTHAVYMIRVAFYRGILLRVAFIASQKRSLIIQCCSALLFRHDTETSLLSRT